MEVMLKAWLRGMRRKSRSGNFSRYFCSNWNAGELVWPPSEAWAGDRRSVSTWTTTRSYATGEFGFALARTYLRFSSKIWTRAVDEAPKESPATYLHVRFSRGPTSSLRRSPSLLTALLWVKD